ncbi:g11006 [Coccomyxa elongata]
MNPSLSFSLDERTVAALLQEDESTFNVLGSLLPSAASAALAAAEAQLGDPSALQAANAAAMHHLLQLHAGQAGASQSADSRREWANAVLEALRSQNKLPGQPSLPPPSPQQPSAAEGASAGGAAGGSAGAGPSGSSSGGGGGRPPTGLSGSFAHLFPQQSPPSAAKNGGHQSSIYHSPFAAHPRSNPAQPGGSRGGAGAMPPLPSPKAEGHASQVPNSPASRTGLQARARSQTNDSAVSGKDDAEAPACFSGESNDSHAEHQGRPVAGEAAEMDTEELRLRRIQEKNRRNQRKFRARQRAKLEDSEAQVRELSRQVMALERAKLELEVRNRQLEATAARAKDPPAPSSTPQGQAGEEVKDDSQYFESLSVFVSKVRGESFTWEQARDMTFKDIAKNVEMYHNMLSRLFEQGAEDPDSAAHAELVELLALKNASEFQTWKSRPQLIHMQYAMLNEASGSSDAPRLAKWQSIVMALQLSEEQKERLLAARTYLLAQMMEIIQERTLIISMLQGAVPSMEEGRQQNAGYLNASAAAERLQRNVNREHFLCTDFLLAFWQVATPLQQAKCELLAFPWTPDVLAMCNLLAASATEMADVKRSYESQQAKAATHQASPFNCLLMPELASLQDGAVQMADGSAPGLAEVLDMKAFASNA